MVSRCKVLNEVNEFTPIRVNGEDQQGNDFSDQWEATAKNLGTPYKVFLD